jgi:hypothetical protein
MHRWELVHERDIHASVILRENSTSKHHLMGELIGQEGDAMVFNVETVDSQNRDMIRFRVPFTDDKLEILYSDEDSAASITASIRDVVFYDEDGNVMNL